MCTWPVTLFVHVIQDFSRIYSHYTALLTAAAAVDCACASVANVLLHAFFRALIVLFLRLRCNFQFYMDSFSYTLEYMCAVCIHIIIIMIIMLIVVHVFSLLYLVLLLLLLLMWCLKSRAVLLFWSCFRISLEK